MRFRPGHGRPYGSRDKKPRRMSPRSLANLRPGPKRRKASPLPPPRMPRTGGRPFGARDRQPRRMHCNSLENLLGNKRPQWLRGVSPNPAGRALRSLSGHITEKGRDGIAKHYQQRSEEQRRHRHEIEEHAERMNREQRGDPEPIDRYDWAGHRQAARSGGHHGQAQIRRGMIRGPRWHRPPR
jgi:hypothetical protein